MCPRHVPVHLQGEFAVPLQDMERNNIISRSQSHGQPQLCWFGRKMTTHWMFWLQRSGFPLWTWLADQVQCLGHVISAEGVAIDPAKMEAVHAWPEPINVREVRGFVGLASYYCRFVPGFAELARLLHKLTEKGVPFKWTHECQNAF
ncbi:hypothetical protein MHYP_G00161110 [Metynnis hypsauchen]